MFCGVCRWVFSLVRHWTLPRKYSDIFKAFFMWSDHGNEDLSHSYLKKKRFPVLYDGYFRLNWVFLFGRVIGDWFWALLAIIKAVEKTFRPNNFRAVGIHFGWIEIDAIYFVALEYNYALLCSWFLAQLPCFKYFPGILIFPSRVPFQIIIPVINSIFYSLYFIRYLFTYAFQ